jgi:hypothetical protein
MVFRNVASDEQQVQTGTSSNFLELGSQFFLKSIGTELQPGFEFFQNPNWGLRVWVEML